VSSNEKKSKLGKKGSSGGHLTQFCNFGPPPNISRTVEAKNYKFGTEMEGGEL